MPEGPQVRRVGKMIGAYAGRPIIKIAHPASREPWELELPRQIAGVETKGKNIFIRLDNGQIIYNHMLMWGRWLPKVTTEGRKRLNTAFYFTDGSELGYYGGGILKLISSDEAAAIIVKIGPDVLDAEAGVLAQLISGATSAVGEVLLDQTIISGVGNIYKSEAMFAARIHPELPAAQIPDEKLKRLVAWLQQQMRADVIRGGITTTPPNLAKQGIRRFVYRRRGQACLLCSTKILRIEQGSNLRRSTYFCPVCQTIDKT
jgi:DNA-formamidopyrimidine glycosylase